MNANKIFTLEIGFFIFYFLILQLATDIQMHYTYGNNFSDALIHRLTYFPAVALPYFFFYRYAVQSLLLKKQYVLFCVSILLFIGLLELVVPVYDWLVTKSVFLPASVQEDARSNLNGPDSFPSQTFSLTLYNTATLSGFGYFIKTLNDETRFRKLKEQHLQLELENLKAYLQPHFFFNTLNNIYSLVIQKSEEAAPALDRLSELMRYIIYDCKKEKVLLSEEVRFIHNYIALEKIRHKKADIRFDQQGNTESLHIEPLLFISLIENAFKHGINQSLSQSWVHIAFIVFEDEILLEVKNNKPPKGQPKECTEKGIGLQNVRKRLELLYPDRHSLTVEEGDNIFEVGLHITINT
jgi:hypothetical protein